MSTTRHTESEPVVPYMDAAEAILVEAVYEPCWDSYRVNALQMEQFREWHHRITGRRIEIGARHKSDEEQTCG
jgi:hypothetical protein